MLEVLITLLVIVVILWLVSYVADLLKTPSPHKEILLVVALILCLVFAFRGELGL